MGLTDNLIDVTGENSAEPLRSAESGQFVPELPDEAVQIEQEKAEDSLLESLDGDEEQIGIEITPLNENSETPDMVAGVEKDEVAAEEAAVKAETEQVEGTPDDLTRSLAALKRDGLPQSVINKMTNEEIMDLGAKRLKVQGDTDDTYRQLAEVTNSDDTASESETEATESATPAPPTSPTPIINLKEAVAPFSDLFGEEAASALESYTSAAVGDTQTRLAEVERVNEALSGSLEKLMMDRARRNLGEQYPQISSEENYGQVTERMKSLVKSGDYKDYDSLMSDAARIEFADYSASSAASLRQQRNQMKEQGQMAPTTSAPSEKSLTTDEAEDQILDLLESGVSINDAKQQLGL